MVDVQAAVVRVVQSKDLEHNISEAIAILLFIAEFPEHFPEQYVQKVFIGACDTKNYPSIQDMEQLMAHPALLVAMMKYREGKLRPGIAVWGQSGKYEQAELLATKWLTVELKSLGLAQ